MTEAPRLSVVVPTRNEADNVDELCSRLLAALQGIEIEICFVDDSDDATPARLAALARADPRLQVVARTGAQRQGGLSTAVADGLRLCRGRFVCVMDSDLQHPPELIPELLERAEAGADLVIASRYITGGSRSGLGSGTRRAVSRGAAGVARLLFSEARLSTDPLSGFFLCRRALIDGIEFRPVGFKILLELLVCVPGLRVAEVPLDFQPRAAGASKASLRQGLLFAGHLRSLFFDVQGSARTWKFGLVGLSGLAVFLPLLALLSGPGHLAPLLAFLPAFALSLLWNTAANRVWTFADLRHRSDDGFGRYLQRALGSGLVMIAADAALLAAGLPVVLAGLCAAAVAMTCNGLLNQRMTRRRAAGWTPALPDTPLHGRVESLAAQLGADRAYLVPPDAHPGGLPAGLVARAAAQRRPALFTEAASHRPQRRSNIDATSILLIPLVSEARVVAVLVCERTSRRGFAPEALDEATRAAAQLVPLLEATAGPRATEGRPAAAARPGQPA